MTSLNQAEKAKLAELLSEKDKRIRENRISQFKPYKYQENFYVAGSKYKHRLLMAANRIGKCLIYKAFLDTPDGKRTVGDLYKEGKCFDIYAWDGEKKVVAKAHAPFSKGMHECYELVMSDGSRIGVADHHRILLENGNYCFAEDLYAAHKHQQGISLSQPCDGLNVAHCLQTSPDLEGNCLNDPRQYDALLRQKLGNALKLSQQQVDALDNTRLAQLEDALDTLSSHTLLFSSLSLLQSVCGPSSLQASSSLLSLAYSPPMLLSGNSIIAIEPIGSQEVYDFEVEKFHNYIASDMVHHNSYSGATEVSFHLTGQYPKWWKGLRFDHPVRIIAGGVTTERTRDIVQKELAGEPSDPSAFGTGAIPRKCIVDKVRRAGIPNAISALIVKHAAGGNSKITFQSYESGKDAWMGDNAHFVWLDEEPPEDIYTQALRALIDLDGKLMMTFTPENGITGIVKQYMQEIKPHQFLLNATWDDAPHITKQVKQEMLAAFPVHQREMRSKGIPIIGSGLVYSTPEDQIVCDNFKIPDHWRRISGIDFGFDHATAWVNLAHDTESGKVYLIEAVKIHKTVIPEIASVLKRKNANKIPVAWPHDGLKHDTYSGRTIRDLYEGEGIKMLPEKFTNPPSPGMVEGSGGNGIEAGIAFIDSMMEQGLFKVFKTNEEWFKEFRLYHRKNGKIVDRNDDLMAATRYAALSLRFAIIPGQTYGVYIPKPEEYMDSIVAY